MTISRADVASTCPSALPPRLCSNSCITKKGAAGPTDAWRELSQTVAWSAAEGRSVTTRLSLCSYSCRTEGRTSCRTLRGTSCRPLRRGSCGTECGRASAGGDAEMPLLVVRCARNDQKWHLEPSPVTRRPRTSHSHSAVIPRTSRRHSAVIPRTSGRDPGPPPALRPPTARPPPAHRRALHSLCRNPRSYAHLWMTRPLDVVLVECRTPDI